MEQINNPLTLLTLFSSLCFLFVFAKIWGQKRNTDIHKAFSLFTFSYFLIVLLEYLSRQKFGYELTLLFVKIAASFLILTGFFILNIIYVIINRKRDLIYHIFLLIAILGMPAGFFPNAINLTYIKKLGYYISTPSIFLSSAYLFSTIIPALYAVFIGFKYNFTTQNIKEKRTLKLLLTGISISIIFGLILIVILPSIFPEYLNLFYEFSALTSLFLLFYLYKAINEYYLKVINYAELEQVSSSLFCNLEEAVLLFGRFGEIVDYNKNAANLLGEVQSIKDIDHKINNYNNKITYTDFKTTVKLDDDLINVKINQSKVEKEGNILGSLLIIKDITQEEQLKEDQKKLTEQVLKSEKMQAIGQLAGGVAHDFNNQLAAIMGCADLVYEEVEDNNYLMELSTNILASAKKASTLTQQLLAFAQKGKYLSSPIDIHHLIEGVVTFLTRSLNKKIDIITKFNSNNCIVIGDPSQMNDVFLNLALNAKDAMENGGILTFSTENCHLEKSDIIKYNDEIKEGNYLKIIISDTGCGMPKEIVNKIFDPFFTTKKLGKGTGMGLAAVYGIIKNHQGYITAESIVDKGTRFIIYLPCIKENSIKAIDSNNNSLNTENSKGNILIIDDEKIVSLTTSKTLTKLGYSTTVYQNSEEALEHYKSNFDKYDLIILDLIMPVIDGYEMFKLIREINPDAKIVLASGYSMDSKIQKLLVNGASDFLQKPFRMNDLEKIVKGILNGDKKNEE